MIGVTEAVRTAREQHQALLVDRVTIERPAREETGSRFDPIRRGFAPVAADVPALVQAANLAATTASPGVSDLTVSDFVAKVPVGTDVAKGDKLRVTTATLMPSLAGTEILVTQVQTSSIAVVTRVLASRAVPTKVRP